MRQIKLFIAGYGKVGKALVDMLTENREGIAARRGRELVLCGLANTRRYILDTKGIPWEEAAVRLVDGIIPGTAFTEALPEAEGCSVFVDCTADPDMGKVYPSLFARGYNVVACNKIPFSGSYEDFRKLEDLARINGVSLNYETTAGAALPVLVTLDRVVQSGDRFEKMDAVLSGTLNYLLDNYKGVGFDSLVENAKQKGFTEPDPSIDLSGKDVLRKIIILSRQLGIGLEESQVALEPIPSDIADRYSAAHSRGKLLRYVASVDASGKAVVGLQEVDSDSSLAALHGTDNAVLITTRDYPSPMLIQGAGAGPRQTAGGLLSDILRV